MTTEGRRPETDGDDATSRGAAPVPPGEGARGADLARQALARAKEDARARARGAGRGRGARGRDAEAPGDGRGPDPDGREAPRRPRIPGIAAPGREWREPVAFGSAVRRLLAERGWQARASDASVLARWDVIVGPDIASHCVPVSLQDGELELAAESTAWATQLRMLSRQILATLRAELGPDVVRRIVVRGPTAPSWRHGRLRASDGRGPRDTYG